MTSDARGRIYERPDPDESTEEILRRIVADYDLRRQTRWGRFLLWLLRKTT